MNSFLGLTYGDTNVSFVNSIFENVSQNLKRQRLDTGASAFQIATNLSGGFDGTGAYGKIIAHQAANLLQSFLIDMPQLDSEGEHTEDVFANASISGGATSALIRSTRKFKIHTGTFFTFANHSKVYICRDIKTVDTEISVAGADTSADTDYTLEFYPRLIAGAPINTVLGLKDVKIKVFHDLSSIGVSVTRGTLTSARLTFHEDIN